MISKYSMHGSFPASEPHKYNFIPMRSSKFDLLVWNTHTGEGKFINIFQGDPVDNLIKVTALMNKQ